MIQKCILWVVFLPNAFQIGYWRNRNPQTLMGADKKYPNRSQLFLAKGPRKGLSSKVEMITVYSDQTPQEEKKKAQTHLHLPWKALTSALSQLQCGISSFPHAGVILVKN